MRNRTLAALFCLSFLPLGLAGTATAAMPLKDVSWDNPTFVKQFTGSYGFDTEKTPAISTSEKALFEQIAPLMGSDLGQAAAILQKAITPESSAALHYTLGNILFQTGRNEEAITAYKESLKKFPNFARAQKNLGILLIQQGKYEDALDYLLAAAKGGSLDGSTMGLTGYAYLNMGKNQSALDAYRLALIFDPSSRDWRMGKAQCLINIGENREAIALLDEMIDDADDQADLLLLQANAYLADNRPMEAAANLEIVNSMGKADASSLVLLGDIFVNANNPDVALAYYQQALDGNKLDSSRILRAIRILAARESWSEADALVSSANEKLSERLSPAQKTDLMNLQAQIALGQNDDARAAEILEQVVAADPLNGRALLLLGDYYGKTGEPERAEIYYGRAQKVLAVAHEALLQHARLLVGQRNYVRAAELLERAQSIDPQANVASYLAKVSAAAQTMPN